MLLSVHPELGAYFSARTAQLRGFFIEVKVKKGLCLAAQPSSQKHLGDGPRALSHIKLSVGQTSRCSITHLPLRYSATACISSGVIFSATLCMMALSFVRSRLLNSLSCVST